MRTLLDLFSNAGFTAILGVVLGQLLGWMLGRWSTRSDRDRNLLADVLAAYDEQSRNLGLALLRGEFPENRDGLDDGERRFAEALSRAEMGVRRGQVKPLQDLRHALLVAGSVVAAGGALDRRARAAYILRKARDAFLKEVRGIDPEPLPDFPEDLMPTEP